MSASMRSRLIALSTSPPQSDQARNFSTIHAARPAGESVKREGQRLRTGALDPLITGLLARPVRQFAEIALLLLGRIGKGRGIAARGHHQIDVDADHPVLVRIAEPAGDRGAPVAALRAETAIAEHVMHQGGDTIRHFGNAEPLLAGAKRQAVSRQGRRHHGEGVARVAAEARGIGEARNDLEKFEHRARPAVQQKQRHRVGADAGHMQIMQVDAVERDAELRKGVERCFLRPPVKPVAPVFGEFAKISDIGAIGPGLAGRLIGKARAGKTLAQIGDVGVGDVKGERAWVCWS